VWAVVGHYTKYDIECLVIFSVVTTLSCSTLIFNLLTTTLNMILSVWLYLALLPPYPAQH
jgi:hypothetical protein